MADYRAVKLMHCWNEYCFKAADIGCFVDVLVVWWWGGGWWAYCSSNGNQCWGGWGWGWWVRELMTYKVPDAVTSIVIWDWWNGWSSGGAGTNWWNSCFGTLVWYWWWGGWNWWAGGKAWWNWWGSGGSYNSWNLNWWAGCPYYWQRGGGVTCGNTIWGGGAWAYWLSSRNQAAWGCWYLSDIIWVWVGGWWAGNGAWGCWWGGCRCQDASFYGGWGWWSWPWWKTCWCKWYQWLVVVRYATDWSYWISCATGGTVSTCGNYTIHCFTEDWTFCIIS